MTDRLFQALYMFGSLDARRMPGFVYFLRAVDGGPVKIGYTEFAVGGHSVERRLAQIQCYSPVPLHAIAFWPAAPTHERELHVLFKSDRLHGEWFTWSDDLAALVATLDDNGALDEWFEAQHTDALVRTR